MRISNLHDNLAKTLRTFFHVIPAQAGIQGAGDCKHLWTPACAGVTAFGVITDFPARMKLVITHG